MRKLEELNLSGPLYLEPMIGRWLYICARMPRVISFDPGVNTEYTNYTAIDIIAKRLNALVVKRLWAFFINDS